MFAALFTVWWVKKPAWSANVSGRELPPRPAPAEVPPRGLVGFADAATFRPDIEGLRALAVILVLLFHARFPLFAGGLIGVDVFFVLSGFLITSLLLRELSTTGTVSLANFWARRARRLLPASGLVLIATVLAARFIVDPLTQVTIARDGLAAALFAANVHFFRGGTNYLAEGLPESPLLHFWSLAVEEQFYVVWPGLLLVLVRHARLRRAALATLMAVAWVVSLGLCVWMTYRGADEQSWAFFMLPARAWELLSGALLALFAPALARVARGAVRTLAMAGWVGLGVVLGTALVVTKTGHPLFPGFVAVIPVLGTVAVIVAGCVGAPDGPVLLLKARPLQWIGARSYAIYLWHFPLLALAAEQWGTGRLIEGLSVGVRLGLLAASVALAALSYALVENPVRFAPSLARNPARSLAVGAWVALLSLGAAGLLFHNPSSIETGEEVATPVLSTVPLAPSTTTPSTATLETGSTTSSTSSTSTTEAPPVADASKDNPTELAALLAANLPVLEAGVATAKVPSNLSPSLGSARDDLPHAYSNGCILDVGDPTPNTGCLYGDPGGTRTVVLFGDSHAAQWLPALHKVASERGWRLIVHTKKACPTAEIPTEKDPNRTDCVPWREAVIGIIGELHPDLVIMSAYRYKQVGSAAGRDPDTVWSEGIELTVSKVRPLTDHLVLLGDSATPLDDVPSCVAGNSSNVAACMNSRANAVRPGRLAVERAVAELHDADFIPTSDWMCTDTACPVVVGNVLMYRDNSHITATASLLLAPYLDAALVAILTR